MNIWGSVALMTAFDVSIIGAVVYSCYITVKHRNTLRQLGAHRGAIITLAGLTIFGLFYFIDLITMHLLPFIIGNKSAMEYMEALHLQYSWFTTLTGSGLIAVGMVMLTRRLLPNIATLFDQLHEKKDELDRATGTDFLTGLPNRRSFFNSLLELLSASRRNNDTFAILFVDLDNFKKVNDVHGHAVGDAILQECARRISGTVRDDDLIARMGGDEFIIALANIHYPDDAILIAEKIVDAVKQPYPYNGHQFSIGATVGISHYPHDSRDIDLLILHADRAMSDAKNCTDNVCIFQRDQQDSSAAS